MSSQIGYFDSLKSVAGKVFSYLSTITLTGTDGKTLTVEENSLVNQDLTSDASPAFVNCFLSGAGRASGVAGKVALSLSASTDAVAANGQPGDKCQITLTYKNTLLYGIYSYATMIVRVVYGDSTTTAVTALYKVEIAQYDNGDATEYAFNVTALCEKAAVGNWTPPGVGGFAIGSLSTGSFIFTIQNLCAAGMYCAVQVFNGLNINSVSMSAVD